MRNFFLRLRFAWNVMTKYPVVVLPDFYWNDSDSKAWSNFLGTDTGAKLRNLRFNRVYESQQRAICDRKDPAYSAGMAFGILAMTSEEDQLLAVNLPQPDVAQQQSGFSSINR